MRSDPPKTVSVIVPARDAAAYLPNCLEALRNSKFAPLEILVVDDGGSRDGTAEVARRFGVRVLELPERLGPGGARNEGVAASRGEILVFVDSDVCVLPDAIGALVAALEDDPGVDAAFGSYDRHPARRNLASQYKNLLHHFVHQRASEDAETFWAGLGAVRRRAFEAVGGFDAALYRRPSIEDIEFGSRLHASGRRIRLVKDAQGSHLKRWTARGVWRSDVLDRGMPWTELILATGRMPRDLNLGTRHRVGVAATILGFLCLAAGPFFPPLFLAAGAALATALLAGGDVLRFFAKERGMTFAVRVAPFHLAYYLACGVSFALGMLRQEEVAETISGRFDSKGVLQNATVLGIGEVAARGFSFLAYVHLGRVLGPSLFGRLELATAVVLYLTSVSTFGLNIVGTRRVAVDPLHAPAIARSIVSIRLALAFLGAAALTAATFFVPRFAEMRGLLLLTLLTTFIEAVSLAWVFQGTERMKWLAAVGILGQAVYAAGVFLFVRERTQLLRVPVFVAIGGGVAAGILGFIAIRGFRGLPAAGRPAVDFRSIWAEALPIGAAALASLVAYNADVVMLGFFLNDRHVGLYRAAGRIAGALTMLGASYATASFPAMARSAVDPAMLRAALMKTVRTTAFAWTAGSVAVVAAAPFLLRATFGSAYAESVFTLRVLVVASAVVGVRAQYRNALFALKLARRTLPATIWAAIVNVVLNVLWIRPYGLRGVAAAAIVSELVMFVFIEREVVRALRGVAA
ncbi:MAG: glycosyltransferase [Thermoanaerobaculia bacterium]